jgi:anti-sigma regulatory factor (Ser/Thr protein kinase)
VTDRRFTIAVAELIWNAADADASRIDVEIESNDFGMQAITVRDHGHGIPHDRLRTCSESSVAPGRRMETARKRNHEFSTAKRCRRRGASAPIGAISH